jgi:malate synthase
MAIQLSPSATPVAGQFEILTPEALHFLSRLHEEFAGRRRELLELRKQVQARFDAGEQPGFLDETAAIRDGEWSVAPAPENFNDRRVEITGPVDRKMMINALNSGAKVFMADCEDSCAPTWENVIVGQENLRDAYRGTISLTQADGKSYQLGDETATLVVRPRGWHLDEKHLRWNGAAASGSLVDFGLCFFHNAAEALARGSGPYFYLPKTESYLEARLWNDVFTFAEKFVGIPHGSVRATVLIETFPAAFQMEEILYELRDHAAGLNAGRWDYIFSTIKTQRNQPGLFFPDRAQVTMAVPFMRAYTELLVRTCHKRGAHAIGGMAAFIPNRRDPEITARAIEQVTSDKQREAGQGYDGTWVAHPDLVPVAMAVFNEALGPLPNQKHLLREDVSVTAEDLRNFHIEGGKVTEAGMRLNISVGIQYLNSWLCGNGAAAINNLMEDAATAEISRSQLWQWIHKGATLEDGRPVTLELYRSLKADELAKLPTGGRLTEAAEIFDQLIEAGELRDFLTLPAYQLLS